MKLKGRERDETGLKDEELEGENVREVKRVVWMRRMEEGETLK